MCVARSHVVPQSSKRLVWGKAKVDEDAVLKGGEPKWFLVIRKQWFMVGPLKYCFEASPGLFCLVIMCFITIFVDDWSERYYTTEEEKKKKAFKYAK